MLKLLEAVMMGGLIVSRLLIALMYLGLAVALILLSVEFFVELIQTIAGLAVLDAEHVILAVLKVIDLVLIANLVLIMISAGIARFETPIMSDVRFFGLLLKLLVLLVVIAAIALLDSFVEVGAVNKTDLEWRLAILATFVMTGILVAWMDRLTKKRMNGSSFHNRPAAQ
jgi:uncharacterized protein (TIGR00645 family)